MSSPLLRAFVALALASSSIAAAAACASPAPAPGELSPKKDKSDDDDDQEDDGDKQSAAAISAKPTDTADAGATLQPSTTANATCETARAVGTVKGDTGGPPAMTEGRCTEWIKVRVVEDDSGWFGTGMKVRATLTPPPGASFELQAFVNTGSDVDECRAPTGTPRNTNGVSEVDLEWGEGFVANSSDDARTVHIQVRSATGGCAPQAWKLAVTHLD